MSQRRIWPSTISIRRILSLRNGNRMALHSEKAGVDEDGRVTTRAVLARIRIPLIATIGLLLLGGTPCLTGYSRADELSSLIDARLGELGVKPSTIELTSQKALRVHRAIAVGDFATANQITTDVLAHSQVQNWRYYPFEDFVGAVFLATTPEFASRLDEWVAKQETDALPLLFRAQYYYDVGWAERGHNFAAKTEPERMAAFVGDMEKALIAVNAALRLDAHNPFSYYLKLRILQGNGRSQAFGAAFEEAIAKYPAYYPPYEIALSTLQPRWGGKIPAMYEFVDKYAGNAPQFSPLKLLYLSFYRHLLSTASA